MGARADALAKRFEEATKAVTDILTRLSDADWKKLTGGEKWSVGVVAHHVAMGHAGISNLVKSVAIGKAAPHAAQREIVRLSSMGRPRGPSLGGAGRGGSRFAGSEFRYPDWR